MGDGYCLNLNNTIDNRTATSTDTNETVRMLNITSIDCPAGNYSYGHYDNGTVACRDDIDTDTDTTIANASACAVGEVLMGDGYCLNLNNTIDNRTIADTKGGNTSAEIIAAVNITAQYQFGANSSDYWDNYSTTNSTWFENVGGTLNLILTQLTTWVDAWLTGKTTDDLTEGSSNLYDNSSWNQAKADGIFNDTTIATLITLSITEQLLTQILTQMKVLE